MGHPLGSPAPIQQMGKLRHRKAESELMVRGGDGSPNPELPQETGSKWEGAQGVRRPVEEPVGENDRDMTRAGMSGTGVRGWKREARAGSLWEVGCIEYSGVGLQGREPG